MNVGCPNCGAPITFRAGSSVCTVCPNCRSAVLRSGLDAAALKSIGKVAQLALTDSALTIGTRGVYEGRAMTVLGHLQLDFGAGVWDEFYAVFVDVQGLETWGWIAEAQGQLLVTFPERAPAISYDAVQVPMSIAIGNRSFIAQERGLGHFVAAEGELPTEIEIGQNFGYVDLSGDHGAFATLDYGHGNRAAPEIAYVGRTVTREALGLPPLSQVEREAGMRQGPKAEGKALTCPKCGAPIELRAPGETKQIACGHCNSLLDATKGELAWLRVLDQLATVPKIPIGAESPLDKLLGESTVAGQPAPLWKVIGYMTRKCNVEGTDYFWDEYLLYAPGRGFRYLTEQDGHWSIVVPIEVGSVVMMGDDVALHHDQCFQKFSEVTAVVARVLGEFPWQVAIGERTVATDFVLPAKGLTLSRELEGDGTRSEIHWSKSKYVESKALYAAFGVKSEAPIPLGIAPNQPSPAAESLRAIGRMCALFVAAWIVALIFIDARAADHLVFKKHVELPLPKDDLATTAASSSTPAVDGDASEAAYFSEPFEIKQAGAATAHLETTLTNSYLWVGGALIQQETGEVHEFELEGSSYAGVEDGESWSEGSPNASTTIGGVTPGSYVLRLQPQTDKTPGHATGFDFTLREGVAVLWPGVFVLLLILIVPLIAWFRAHAFESRRWSESTVRNAYSSSADSDSSDEEES